MSDTPHAPAVVPMWSPLRHASFRRLWTAWLAACICMWINDVAAAWLMTSLTRSPVMVALVQTAATLPVFLLGLPSGAVADLVDRRRLLIATQLWAALVALALLAATLAGTLAPGLLLLLVFANGIVLAARWPAFSAVLPELVPRDAVSAASALSGVANNGSRFAGPLVAGALLASGGASAVFALNAALALASALLLWRWVYAHPLPAALRPAFVEVVREGLRHVRGSSRMRGVLALVAGFFGPSVALVALLPLVARGLAGGGAGTFTLLMAAMGAGAVAAAFALPLLNRRVSALGRYVGGNLAYAAASLAVAVGPSLYLALLALFAAGCAYMVTANTLMVAGTLALPGWVRARGLSIYQMVMMGSTALGAVLWGGIASASSVGVSLALAGAAGAGALVLTRRSGVDALHA